jgi:hypothetical protein
LSTSKASTSHTRVDFTAAIRMMLIIVTMAEGAALAVLVVVLFLLSSQVHAQSTVNACEARYVTALTSALQARAVIGDQSAAATVMLQGAVAADVPASLPLKAAYTQYANVEAALRTQRSEHPIPPAAQCV